MKNEKVQRMKARQLHKRKQYGITQKKIVVYSVPTVTVKAKRTNTTNNKHTNNKNNVVPKHS